MAPVPKDIPDSIATQLLVNSITALLQLRAAERAAPERAGRNGPILLTAAGSTVARIMTVLALQRGLKQISIVRSQSGADALKTRFPELTVITTEDGNWQQHVRAAAEGEPIEVAIDPIGGLTAVKLIELLSDGGTLLVYGGLDHQPISVPSILLSAREIAVRGVSIKRWLETSSPELRRQDVADSFAIRGARPSNSTLPRNMTWRSSPTRSRTPRARAGRVRYCSSLRTTGGHGRRHASAHGYR